jgi:hypothetical protein
VNVLVTYSNLPKARGEVKMDAQIRVLQLIDGVIHSRKWVDVLKRNLVKAAVVNAQSKRANGFTNKKNRRA